MLNLHYFFRNSGKCWRILLLIAERLDVLTQRFPKSSGTRFQVHKYRGLKVLIVNFLPLCLFAENMLEANNKACDTQQKAKLQGYLHQWLSYQYLTSLQLYRLVLQETAHLSFVCQSSKTLVTEVVEEMESTCQRLNDLSERDTDFPFPVQEENDSVTITVEATNLPATQRFKEKNQLTEKQRVKAEKCISVVRESYSVKRVHQGRKAVNRIKEKLIPAIATHLTARMKSFDDDIFKAFKIAYHSNYDYMNAEYGVKEVREIAEYFSESLKFHGFSLHLALSEWKSLKQLIQTKYQHFTNKISLWHQIFIHFHEKYPHILLIIELILVTPYSSASVERGFSLMNRLLANTRLNMSNKTLNDLMVLRVNLSVLCSCDSGYKRKLMDKAVDLYLDAKKRHTSAKQPATENVHDLQSQMSQDTFLPLPIGSLMTSNELTCDQTFFALLSEDDSEDSTSDSDTDSD